MKIACVITLSVLVAFASAACDVVFFMDPFVESLYECDDEPVASVPVDGSCHSIIGGVYSAKYVDNGDGTGLWTTHGNKDCSGRPRTQTPLKMGDPSCHGYFLQDIDGVEAHSWHLEC